MNISKWTVAIFSSRESVLVLKSCIDATLRASCGVEVTIDILINGNRKLADDISQCQINESDACIRVWFIPLGDKAHAWNEYVRHIWQESDVAYFIDGYVLLNSDALLLISQSLNVDCFALGASGVPSWGQSAQYLRKKMLAEGGIHGNCFAIRGSTLQIMKENNFHLPIGIYRTDPLIGAVLSFNLDPAQNSWDPRRILVHPNATWRINPAKWYKFDDVKAYFHRKLRQAQGVLENLAVKEHLAVQKLAPESLPITVFELINNWVYGHPKKAFFLFLRRPFCFLALQKINRRNWFFAQIPPKLIWKRNSK